MMERKTLGSASIALALAFGLADVEAQDRLRTAPAPSEERPTSTSPIRVPTLNETQPTIRTSPARTTAIPATTLRTGEAVPVSGEDLFALFWDHPTAISGIYSEKASFGGQPGLGGQKFATTATGDDMVVAVHGLHGKNPRPTRVAVLDANALMAANGGQWPLEPAALRSLLNATPSIVLFEIAAEPPATARVAGVPKGKKLVVLTGFEGIVRNVRPPQSQALVANFAQLAPKAQALVPEAATMSLAD